MTEEERVFARKAIETYKQIRPVIQQGDLYRLISPYDDLGVASLMYITPEKERAVFFAFKTMHYQGQIIPRFRMAGLETNKQYRLTELNVEGKDPLAVEGKVFSGALLMNTGIELPLPREYASRVLELVEVR